MQSISLYQPALLLQSRIANHKMRLVLLLVKLHAQNRVHEILKDLQEQYPLLQASATLQLHTKTRETSLGRTWSSSCHHNWH